MTPSRADLVTVLEAESTLDAFTIYAEPPEHLAGGASLVVAPRSPYRVRDTLGTWVTRLTVHVLVPRSQGPAMDLIDAAIDSIVAAVETLSDADLEDVSAIGIVDDVGGASYTAAVLNITL